MPNLVSEKKEDSAPAESRSQVGRAFPFRHRRFVDHGHVRLQLSDSVADFLLPGLLVLTKHFNARVPNAPYAFLLDFNPSWEAQRVNQPLQMFVAIQRRLPAPNAREKVKGAVDKSA